MYFRASRRKSFSYFLKVALEHGGCPPKPFQKKQKQKKGKSWKLLLILVTESFILYVAGLLDLTLKHIDKFRSNTAKKPQQNPPKNTRKASFIFKVNNKDTRRSVASNFEHISHFILLLLLLNSNKCWLGLRIHSFNTINLFSVTMRIILTFGLGKIVCLYVFIFFQSK